MPGGHGESGQGNTTTAAIFEVVFHWVAQDTEKAAECEALMLAGKQR